MINSFIDKHLMELECYLKNKVAMSNANDLILHYLKGKVAILDDLIYNCCYDIHQDLLGYSVRITEIEKKIENLATKKD